MKNIFNALKILMKLVFTNLNNVLKLFLYRIEWLNAFCDISQAQNSTIWDWQTDSTGDPQIAHKLSQTPFVKMLISCG